MITSLVYLGTYYLNIDIICIVVGTYLIKALVVVRSYKPIIDIIGKKNVQYFGFKIKMVQKNF